MGAVALLVALLGCGGDETRASAGATSTVEGSTSSSSVDCSGGPSVVPTPELEVDGGMVPMDLVFASGCGLYADGAANLGAAPGVVTVGDAVDVHAATDFGVRVGFVEDGDARVPDEDAEPVVGGSTRVELGEVRCGMLTVELEGAGMRGRFANRVEAAGGDCPRIDGDT